MSNPQEKIAESGAAIVVAGFSLTLSEIDTLVSIGAGLTAIVVGIATAIYYIKKTRSMKNGATPPEDT